MWLAFWHDLAVILHGDKKKAVTSPEVFTRSVTEAKA